MEHQVPAPIDIPSHVQVEVITSIASPLNAHLSNAFEQVWLGAAVGLCSTTEVHRRSVNAVISSWCALESAVNKALYLKLRHEDSPHYLDPNDDRDFVDREISDGLSGNLGFMKRFEYLARDRTCCSVVAGNKGAIKQFERLRNALVHGYVYRHEALAESDPASAVEIASENGTTTVITTFSVGHQEVQDPAGKPIDLVGNYEELGMRHDPTGLCSHDAARCLFLAIGGLSWLDSHFGVVSNASWSLHGTTTHWSTRETPTFPGTPKRVVGGHDIHAAYMAFDKQAKTKRKFQAAIKAKQRGGGKRRRGKN